MNALGMVAVVVLLLVLLVAAAIVAPARWRRRPPPGQPRTVADLVRMRAEAAAAIPPGLPAVEEQVAEAGADPADAGEYADQPAPVEQEDAPPVVEAVTIPDRTRPAADPVTSPAPPPPVAAVADVRTLHDSPWARAARMADPDADLLRFAPPAAEYVPAEECASTGAPEPPAPQAEEQVHAEPAFPDLIEEPADPAQPVDQAGEAACAEPAVERAGEPGEAETAADLAEDPPDAEPVAERAAEPPEAETAAGRAEDPVSVELAVDRAGDPAGAEPAVERAEEPAVAEPAVDRAEEPSEADTAAADPAGPAGRTAVEAAAATPAEEPAPAEYASSPEVPVPAPRPAAVPTADPGSATPALSTYEPPTSAAPTNGDHPASPTPAATPARLAGRVRRSPADTAAEQAAADRALLRTFGIAGPVHPAEPDDEETELAVRSAAAPDLPPGTAQPVTFRIVARSGAGIPAATVTLHDHLGHETASATADTEGRGMVVAPHPGGYVLVAAADGHQPGAAALTVDGAPVRADVMMTRSATLTGTVTGEDGPLHGARVVLVQDGETLETAVTAADGSYRFGELTAGEYGLSVTAPDCDPAAVLVSVADEQQLHRDVELDPAGLPAPVATSPF